MLVRIVFSFPNECETKIIIDLSELCPANKSFEKIFIDRKLIGDVMAENVHT